MKRIIVLAKLWLVLGTLLLISGGLDLLGHTIISHGYRVEEQLEKESLIISSINFLGGSASIIASLGVIKKKKWARQLLEIVCGFFVGGFSVDCILWFGVIPTKNQMPQPAWTILGIILFSSLFILIFYSTKILRSNIPDDLMEIQKSGEEAEKQNTMNIINKMGKKWLLIGCWFAFCGILGLIKTVMPLFTSPDKTSGIGNFLFMSIIVFIGGIMAIGASLGVIRLKAWGLNFLEIVFWYFLGATIIFGLFWFGVIPSGLGPPQFSHGIISGLIIFVFILYFSYSVITLRSQKTYFLIISEAK